MLENWKLALPTMVVAAALALTGCTASAGTTSNPPAGDNRPEPVAEEDTTEEEPAEVPAAPVNPKFGESYEWEDGLVVTVSAPTPFTPSEYAYVGEGSPAYLLFTVTVVNGSEVNYDPTLFFNTLQSGNAEAEAIFDSDNGLSLPPQTALLPGREATFNIGFGVADPNDLVMEVTPGFEYDSVIYTN